MNQRDREIARAVARYLAQWLSGVVAVGALALLGLIGLMSGPEDFVLFLKLGRLSPLIMIFTGSVLAWLLLRVAGARSERHEEC
ncbi:hypothetical protein ACFC08_34250 [Streptomyces sp. NPDC056112]|uniref:hypothetical protein n=1 Tax=Streptomyces sp. NPDC056112 TaxID=3345715 RepID=UPI0035DDAE15